MSASTSTMVSIPTNLETLFLVFLGINRFFRSQLILGHHLKQGNSDRQIFLGSKMTADGDCSHEIKRHLLLWRKAMTNLDSLLKSTDITLLTKGSHSQSYGFSSSYVWMWELDHQESWALKNWCFELCCWRRLLRVSWTARRSNRQMLYHLSHQGSPWTYKKA